MASGCLSHTMWWWTLLLGALLATWPASRFTICNLQYIDSFGCSQNLRQLLIFYQEACSNVTNLRGLLKSHLHLQNIPGSFDKTEFLISCKKMFQVWRIEDMQVIFWRVYSILLGVTIQFFIIYLQVVAIPSEAWGKFFTGDAYIIFARSTFSKAPFSPSP